VVKSDSVAFGEPIPADVAHRSIEEAFKCDLMLVCGTSASVYPFANLPRMAKLRTPGNRNPGTLEESVLARANAAMVIEVNAEPTPLTYGGISDLLLQGKTGTILPRILEEVQKRRDGST
jgi:NAD-dependent SIR2 family protein deacetylase